jgi:hypothetical protein
MTGVWMMRNGLWLHALMVVTLGALGPSSAQGVVLISDGFEDADRDNNGLVELYDTDLNNSGTFNDPGNAGDVLLNGRGITEVTTANNASDVGIKWSGIRSYDTAANIAKSGLKIFNDSVGVGSETASSVFNTGLALGVESRGGGSSFMGNFGQTISLGTNAGDKLVMSFDFRTWNESANPTPAPQFGEFRWGMYQDTDNELGMTGPFGAGFVTAPPGATVTWGRDDGNWFASEPGAEGDRGIRAQVTFGSLASALEPRLQWEYNLKSINGTTNNGRILDGTGVSDTPGAGGDTGTIANPATVGEGPGGIIHDGNAVPKRLSMELLRLADGSIEVASFVGTTEILRDEIKTTDTGYNVIGPPPGTFHYVAFRASTDYDYAIDNFKVESFTSAPAIPGDYSGNGVIDQADYDAWKTAFGTATVLPNDSTPGVNDALDYTVWRDAKGSAVVAGGAVPEQQTIVLTLAMLLVACGLRKSNLFA